MSIYNYLTKHDEHPAPSNITVVRDGRKPVVFIWKILVNNLSIFIFPVRSHSNTNEAEFEVRSRFIDRPSGFSIRVKPENVDSQTTELHPNTSTAAILS